MKPTDLQVYDAFPTLTRAVIWGAQAMEQMPLDQMLTVLDRVEAAGCFNAGGRTTPVTAAEVARHRALIGAAIAFRDAAALALTGQVVLDGSGG